MRKADGIIFVFDLANRLSFESIKDWLIAFKGVKEKFEKILVGNQYNLKNREVEKEKLKSLVKNLILNILKLILKMVQILN